MKSGKLACACLAVLLIASSMSGMTACSDSSDTTAEETSAETTSEDSSFMVGGWDISGGYGSVSSGAAEAFEKSGGEYEGTTLGPVALLGTQVVAGTNYKLLCVCSTGYKVATIYADLSGNAAITSLSDFNIGDYSGVERDDNRASDTYAAASDGEDLELVGGWACAACTAVELSGSEKNAYEKSGLTYEPIAFLGSQLVAGNNFSYICRDDDELVFVTVYVAFDGTTEVTCDIVLNTADM